MPRKKKTIEEGGALSAKHIQEFSNESYEKNARENIDDYTLDKSLSNDYAKTYYDKNTGHAVVVHRGTQGWSDWLNNVAYVMGKYYLTRRNWTGKKIQEAAEKKYGAKNISTLGHSQGAVLARRHGKNSKEVITVNPAYTGEKQAENEYRVRTERDPVSGLLAPVNYVKDKLSGLFGGKKSKEDNSKKNITIKSDTWNPLTEHSYNTLERLDPNQMIGKEDTPEQGTGVHKKISDYSKMPKFEKGSKEARDFMASLRAKRGHCSKGGKVWKQHENTEMQSPIMRPLEENLKGGAIEIHHHHHHHHHMDGEGMWDWTRALDPNKNGVSNAFKKTFTPELGNQIVGGLKTAGHYGIPMATGALGGLAGEFLSGGNPIAGFAGNQAGKMAGQQINKAIGIGMPKKGRGRPRKVCL